MDLLVTRSCLWIFKFLYIKKVRVTSRRLKRTSRVQIYKKQTFWRQRGTSRWRSRPGVASLSLAIKAGVVFFFSLSPSPSRGWYRGHIDRHAAWTSRGFHANAARAGVIFLVRFYNGRPKLGLAIARVDFLSRSDRNRPDLQSELR